jgi:hypothetical protein
MGVGDCGHSGQRNSTDGHSDRCHLLFGVRDGGGAHSEKYSLVC